MRDYLAHIADSRRWRHVPLRPGDIVLSVPSKCGTTWTQMVTALLLFDTADLPGPLSELSPWVDMRTESVASLCQRLEAQSHRRFLKTHVPLDGLPLHPGVHYVVVGRDPRDAWVSMEHHVDNLDIQRALALCVDDDGGEPAPWPDLPEAPEARFRAMLDRPVGSNHTNAHLAQIVHHLHHAWRLRREPNVHLMHYADMKRDLVACMRQLAEFLRIARSDERIATLAEAAHLDAMRASARLLAPNAQFDIWRDTASFFRSASGREWEPWFTPETAEAYHTRVAELTGHDEPFARWLHGGGVT